MEIRDGGVYIGGQRLAEPYIGSVETTCNGAYCDIILKADEYYVLGDNRANSNDSRRQGTLPGKNVLGKVWFVYWPFSELNLLDSFGTAAQGALREMRWP